MHKETNTVNLIVGADPTIGLRRESRDTVQLETSVSTISQEYLLEFTFEYGISEGLHPEFPGVGDRIIDFSEGKVEMNLFNLISAPNPAIVKTGTRQRTAHEVPLLTATASRVIDMEDVVATSTSSGETTTSGFVLEIKLEREVTAMGVLKIKGCRKRERSETEANASPKVLRTNHAFVRPAPNTHEGKSLAAMGEGAGSTVPTSTSQEIPTNVIEPNPLSYARHQSVPERDTAYQDGAKRIIAAWTPRRRARTWWFTLCRFFELCHLPNLEFLGQYNMNLTRQVAMGSQLRLRFKQEVRLWRETMTKIAKRDHRIQVKEEDIKKLDEEVKSLRVVEAEVHGLRNQTRNLETLLEAEVDMKKAAEAKNVDLAGQLEIFRAQLTDLQVSNQQLSQQVSSLQCKITGEEKIKAAFKEFRKLEDEKVERRCGQTDARLDALSVDFKDVLYPHMLTAIAGRQWVIGHGLRLAVMKCAESTKLSDTGEDAPSFIRDLRPSSSQLKIPVYPEVRDPKDPWGVKEEMLLEDAIAANVSQAKKKKKCRIVCRTQEVGFAHYAWSDGVHVFVPIVAPQGLQIMLKDAAIQTELLEDDSSLRLVRSKSLPMM
ncbi:hypothetical protein Tco_1439311 [Tanacetum coccineum]